MTKKLNAKARKILEQAAAGLPTAVSTEDDFPVDTSLNRMQILNTQNIKQQFASLLIYGRANTYKTRWLATAKNPLILDFERGLLSIKDEKIDYIHLNSFAHLKEIFSEIKEYVKDKDITLCIDSLTEMSDMAMTEITADKGLEIAKDDGWATYPLLYEETIKMIRDLLSLQCHVVFIAKHDVTKIGHAELLTPRVQGRRLRSELVHLLDVVLCMQGDASNGRIAISNQNEECDCKDRSGRLPETIDVDNTTLSSVIDMIIGKDE